MAEIGDFPRQIWSCRLSPPEPEEEAERLEEELLSRELGLWEDAEALRRYMSLKRLSQAACARRLDRSQAAVANRLRILKLPAVLREELRRAGLTERHARALLRLGAEDACRAAERMIREKLSVTESEALVEAMLRGEGTSHSAPRRAIEELRGFLSGLQGRCPGLSVDFREEGDHVRFTVRLPKENGEM